MSSPSVEGVFDALEDLTEDALRKILMERIIFALLGAAPNAFLLLVLTPLLKKIFSISVEPMIEFIYRKGQVVVCKMNGRITIRKIENAQDDSEIWDIIHSDY